MGVEAVGSWWAWGCGVMVTMVALGGHGLWDVGRVGLGFGGSLSGGDLVFNSFLGKLHFITLNYILNYTLHPKLFECTLCILNYDLCYILHPNVSFTVKLDKN